MKAKAEKAKLEAEAQVSLNRVCGVYVAVWSFLNFFFKELDDVAVMLFIHFLYMMRHCGQRNKRFDTNARLAQAVVDSLQKN